MKWKLTDIYESSEAWDKDFEKVKSELKELVKYKGKLETKLEEFYTKYENMEIIMYELYVYARLVYDLDLTNQANEARVKKVDMVLAEVAQKLSWISPEIIEIGKEGVFKLIDKSEKLSEYRHSFDSLFYSQKHVLDKKSEELLSNYELFNGSPSEIYSAFRYSDSKPIEVELSDGTKVEVMDQNYGRLLTEIARQEDRKKIFESLYSSFENNKSVLANIYTAIVNLNIAEAKARNYDSFLNMYLDGSKIPLSVYTNLLDICKKTGKEVKRYLDLRKKVLDLEEYHSYDRMTPLVEVKKKYSYKEAKDLVMKAVEDLPQDYINKVKEAMSEGYVDVLPNSNKRGGAYAWGTYKTHPYVLLNYNGNLSDVSTLAHETGHAVHRLYSDEAQPFATHSHSIFVAEVASTFLERVLIEYLKKNIDDKTVKIYLIQKQIDHIISTFYRQAMFADFEYTTHKNISEGNVMTEKEYSELGIDLYKQYYGLDIKSEKYKRLWWAYIPHLFSTPFYVYKYATCHTVSSKLYNDYEKNNSKFENFVDLLKAGGDDYPFNQILKSGVDLSKKETYEPVVEDLKELINELEELLK